MSKTKFTTNEIWSINQTLAFIIPQEVKKAGAKLIWNAVEDLNKIKPVLKSIEDITTKIRDEFYEPNPNHQPPYRLKEGQEKAAAIAEKELNEKTWDLELNSYKFDDIENLSGLTGQHIFNLQPILSK